MLRVKPLHCSISTTNYTGARVFSQLLEMSPRLSLCSLLPFLPSPIHAISSLKVKQNVSCTGKCVWNSSWRCHLTVALLACLLLTNGEQTYIIPLSFTVGWLSCWLLELSPLTVCWFLKCPKKYELFLMVFSTLALQYKKKKCLLSWIQSRGIKSPLPSNIFCLISCDCLGVSAFKNGKEILGGDVLVFLSFLLFIFRSTQVKKKKVNFKPIHLT